MSTDLSVFNIGSAHGGHHCQQSEKPLGSNLEGSLAAAITTEVKLSLEPGHSLLGRDGMEIRQKSLGSSLGSSWNLGLAVFPRGIRGFSPLPRPSHSQPWMRSRSPGGGVEFHLLMRRKWWSLRWYSGPVLKASSPIYV